MITVPQRHGWTHGQTKLAQHYHNLHYVHRGVKDVKSNFMPLSFSLLTFCLHLGEVRLNDLRLTNGPSYICFTVRPHAILDCYTQIWSYFTLCLESQK